MLDGSSRAQSVHSFLKVATGLDDLKDEPLVGEKTSSYRDYLCCIASLGTFLSFGIGLVLAPSMWMLRGQADGASLKLTDEGIEFAQPMPAMCCLKTVKFSVPYESVIRVDLEDGYCISLFGLRKLRVMTPESRTRWETTSGEEMDGIEALFLRDPESMKAAIEHAVTLSMLAPAYEGMKR